MQAVSPQARGHPEHHRASEGRDRQREQSVANQERQPKIAKLLKHALDLDQLMILAHHAGPDPCADRIENRSGKGIHQKGAGNRGSLIQAKAACQENASGDPIKKLGNTPMNDPIAKPMAVWDGEAFSRKTARHFSVTQR